MRRMTGFIFVITAGLGILFSLVGLFLIWKFQPSFSRTAVENLTLVDESLTSTETILTTMKDMVQTTTLDITSLQATTKALSQGLRDANPSLDSLIRLTGTDIPASIDSTQVSIASAESSALLIDNMLTALSKVPLLPIGPYKPTVPLHVALQNVSNSLNTLIPSLEKINTSLTNEKNDLGTVDSELTQISNQTQDINTSLGDAQTAIDKYMLAVGQLKTNVESAEQNIAKWIMAISWILSILFVWMIVYQVGSGLHGLELIKAGEDNHNISKKVEEE